jgi:hypothetical protein
LGVRSGANRPYRRSQARNVDAPIPVLSDNSRIGKRSVETGDLDIIFPDSGIFQLLPYASTDRS